MTDKEKYERLRMALEAILKTTQSQHDHTIAKTALEGIKE